jgi:hypothetical protein
MVRISILSALLLSPCLGSSQKIPKATCAKDGTIHLSYISARPKVIPPEPKQVGCEDPVIAADHRTVGWSILVENCCTSYPIPIAVVVYNNGKKTRISTPQMIWNWHFLDAGKQVAVLSGPVHGSPARALVFDSRTGKLLQQWNGASPVPDWAKDWEAEFEPNQVNP